MNELISFLLHNAIALCALALTVYQASCTRKHNRLTVQPRLTTFTDVGLQPDDETITVIKASLMNNGLGPAIIKTFEILLDDKVLPVSEPEDMYKIATETLQGTLVTNEWRFAVLRKHYAMPKDAEIQLAKVAIRNATTEQLEEFKRFHVRVVYESAYGESFTYDSRIHKEGM